ncbi:MAG: spheroidene monooxygenase [Acidimicrobiales bacterium]
MLASVHLLDGGVRTTIRCLRRTPTPADTPGLRSARTVIAAPLGGSITSPQPGRFGLIAFWDDAAALDEFLAGHPLAEALAGGWWVRLEPLRAVPVASGHFPGVPDGLPTAAAVDHDGPTAVLTIGRLRVNRTVTFLRTSSRAEKQVASAPGVLWATGLANVARRVVSTFSLWQSGAAMRAYATSTSGHAAAISSERGRSFHHAGSFVRLRPHAASGSLPGRNPLPEEVTAFLNHGGPAWEAQSPSVG